MKIGISGTQGVGKSFKLFEIANKYKLEYPDKEVTVVTETARKCPMPINENASLKAQQWMFMHQIQMEIEAENNCDVVITDRTIADYAAYIKIQYEKFYYSILPLLVYYISTYDEIYYISLTNENNYLVDDGVRSVNKEFQKNIDKVLLEIYDKIMFNVKNFRRL